MIWNGSSFTMPPLILVNFSMLSYLKYCTCVRSLSISPPPPSVANIWVLTPKSEIVILHLRPTFYVSLLRRASMRLTFRYCYAITFTWSTMLSLSSKAVASVLCRRFVSCSIFQFISVAGVCETRLIFDIIMNNPYFCCKQWILKLEEICAQNVETVAQSQVGFSVRAGAPLWGLALWGTKSRTPFMIHLYPVVIPPQLSLFVDWHCRE
jgi:hypothetical protein